jgi:uncharacterized protein (DUF362 family)
MKVAIIKNDSLDYNRDAPFNPSIKYPEYPFTDIGQNNNILYDSIRNILYRFGLDEEHYNTKSWNPLGEIIRPGDNVLIKPNLVLHYNLGGNETDQLLTHGSIIRAVVDYVYIALKGQGSMTIGDAPLQEADFNIITKIVGLDKILDFYNKNSIMKINLVDFRLEKGIVDSFGIIKKEKNEGDTTGFTSIDLKGNSELFEIIDDYNKFRVTNYDKNKMPEHHNKINNEYLISNSVLDADVIINLPKLKSHRKAGMTCALKNLVGINGSKDWLPHHRFGSKEEGGDEYLYKSFRKKLLTRLNEKMDCSTNRLYFLLLRMLHFSIRMTRFIIPYKETYFEGSWYGNDTLARTIIDLNKLIMYADKKGILREELQRKMFIIVDGIIAGEGEGPLEPNSKKLGLLVAGDNPVAVDLVCSRIIGFDYQKIPTFRYALNAKKYVLFNGKISEIKIISDKCNEFGDLYDILNCNLIPAKGWRGHIEYEKNKNS